MNGIDSIKIYSSFDILKDIDLDTFINSQKKLKGKLIGEKYTKTDFNTPGLKYIEYDPFAKEPEQIIIQLSAKILKDKYFELININTIDQVLDSINNTNALKIDKSKADQLFIHSADFTKNVNCSYTPGQIIGACKTITNDRYMVETYKGSKDNKNKTGIVFRGKQKTFNERLIIYDKETELKKDTKFLKEVSKPIELIKQFSNVTRTEINVTSHRKLKELCKTDNNLLLILQSNEVPVYKIFNKINHFDYRQLEIFNYPDHYKLYMIEKIEGRKGIIQKLNYDPELVRDFLKKVLGSKNVSRYMKEYSQLITEMKMNENGNVELTNDIIKEFEILLKIA